MIEKGSSTENEMVSAFLRAEINSSIFQEKIIEFLEKHHLSKEILIDNPDFGNKNHNKIRLEILERARNYSSRTHLFKDFPTNIFWRKIELPFEEFKNLKYLNHSFWNKLSNNSRLVVDGARNIKLAENLKEKNVIETIAHDLQNGKVYAELIAVEDNAGKIILIEGHKRATAYIASGLVKKIDIILGKSPEINKWKHY